MSGGSQKNKPLTKNEIKEETQIKRIFYHEKQWAFETKLFNGNKLKDCISTKHNDQQPRNKIVITKNKMKNSNQSIIITTSIYIYVVFC